MGALVSIWGLLMTIFTSTQFREILDYFLKDLNARRADDPRLLDFAQVIMTNLQNTPLTGMQKYTAAFGEIGDYAKTLGIEIGEAGVDSLIQLLLPTVKAQAPAVVPPPPPPPAAA